MQSDKKKGTKVRVCDIQWVQTSVPKDLWSLQRSLGIEVYSLLLFARAAGGCDTTSHLFGIGKGVPLRKLKSDQNFSPENVAYVFFGEATKDEIHHALETALVYGGQPNEGLDKPRHRKFCEKVCTSISLQYKYKLHLHQQLLSITTQECTTRYKSGWAAMRWNPENGDGGW